MLEFQFQVENDLSDLEIEILYKNTQNLQKKFYGFLEGKISDEDFCDLLREYDLDPDEIALIYENNLKILNKI